MVKRHYKMKCKRKPLPLEVLAEVLAFLPAGKLIRSGLNGACLKLWRAFLLRPQGASSRSIMAAFNGPTVLQSIVFQAFRNLSFFHRGSPYCWKMVAMKRVQQQQRNKIGRLHKNFFEDQNLLLSRTTELKREMRLVPPPNSLSEGIEVISLNLLEIDEQLPDYSNLIQTVRPFFEAIREQIANHALILSGVVIDCCDARRGQTYEAVAKICELFDGGGKIDLSQRTGQEEVNQTEQQQSVSSRPVSIFYWAAPKCRRCRLRRGRNRKNHLSNTNQNNPIDDDDDEPGRGASLNSFPLIPVNQRRRSPSMVTEVGFLMSVPTLRNASHLRLVSVKVQKTLPETVARECVQWLNVFERGIMPSERFPSPERVLYIGGENSELDMPSLRRFVRMLVKEFQNATQPVPHPWAVVVQCEREYVPERKGVDILALGKLQAWARKEKRNYRHSNFFQTCMRCLEVCTPKIVLFHKQPYWKSAAKLPEPFRVENRQTGEALTLEHIAPNYNYKNQFFQLHNAFVVRRGPAVGPRPRLEPDFHMVVGIGNEEENEEIVADTKSCAKSRTSHFIPGLRQLIVQFPHPQPEPSVHPNTFVEFSLI